VYAEQYQLQAEFEYRETIGVWFRSLFAFRPDPALMVGAPLIFQIHTLAAFVLFALWPFSSLVHTFSVPLGYFRRSYIQYRSSNPKASLAHEREREKEKKPVKAEQGRSTE
jgi:nitrate reductase gamma subunit